MLRDIRIALRTLKRQPGFSPAVVTGILIATAMIANIAPALRAVRIEPHVALRQE